MENTDATPSVRTEAGSPPEPISDEDLAKFHGRLRELVAHIPQVTVKEGLERVGVVQLADGSTVTIREREWQGKARTGLERAAMVVGANGIIDTVFVHVGGPAANMDDRRVHVEQSQRVGDMRGTAGVDESSLFKKYVSQIVAPGFSGGTTGMFNKRGDLSKGLGENLLADLSGLDKASVKAVPIPTSTT